MSEQVNSIPLIPEQQGEIDTNVLHLVLDFEKEFLVSAYGVTPLMKAVIEKRKNMNGANYSQD